MFYICIYTYTCANIGNGGLDNASLTMQPLQRKELCMASHDRITLPKPSTTQAATTIVAAARTESFTASIITT